MKLEYQTISRNDFTEIIKNNNYNVGVEIGVAQGNYSKYILSNTSIKTMYLIDPFIPEAEGFYCTVDITTKNLEKFADRCIILPVTSTEGSKQIADNSIDFIYIDGDHRESAVEIDLNTWYPKLKVGGLFSGHDYLDGSQPGVVCAVNHFCEQNKIEILNVTTLSKIDELISGKEAGAPSWYFFKK